MRALAQTVFDECAAQAPNRNLQFKLHPLPPARGDAALLRQVWVNLISNAIKYTRPKDTAAIEIGGRTEGGELLYYVKDNGAGFDMDYVKKLFVPFQRLHSLEEFEGTGVGLALVQRIIHRHDGRVWAEGKINEGATFFFTLPHAIAQP
jgi:two-component system sensor kinase